MSKKDQNTIPVLKRNVLKAFKSTDKNGKQLLSDLFGPDVVNQDVTDRIQTIEDAYEETGRKSPDWAEVVDMFPELREFKDYLSAQVDACVLSEAYNEGEKMGYDGEKKHHLPFFRVSCSGFAFYATYYDYSAPTAGRAARLAFKNDKLARNAGEKFPEVYKRIIMK